MPVYVPPPSEKARSAIRITPQMPMAETAWLVSAVVSLMSVGRLPAWPKIP